MLQAPIAHGCARHSRRRGYVFSALLGIMALLFYEAGRAEPSEATDPQLSKEIFYLRLAVRDRLCLPRADHQSLVDKGYGDCMHENRQISYCKARPEDFEALALLMAADSKMREWLPLDRLVRYVSARCIEVDGFIPPNLPLVTVELPAECDGKVPILLAYAVLKRPWSGSSEDASMRDLCRGSTSMTFLDAECSRGAKGIWPPFDGIEDLCEHPIKPARKPRS